MMNRQRSIRKGTLSDIDSLYRIESSSYPEKEGASRESIEARMRVFPDCFWILENEGEILAFVCGMLTDRETLIDEMYEDPSMHDENGSRLMLFSVVTGEAHRGKGYAHQLLKAVSDEMMAKGKKEIVLTCKERLISFYEESGFVSEGVSSSTHGDTTWYQMRKQLGEK